MFKSVQWTGEALRIIDQTELPHKLIYRDLRQISDVFEAIRKLQVRGAPALGVTAAFGLYLGLRNQKFESSSQLINKSRELAQYLSGARPTAVNVDWALRKVMDETFQADVDPTLLSDNLLQAALNLQKDDEARCRKIGEHGSGLIRDGMKVLTHCNTGILATTGIGTALGILSTANHSGKKFQVIVDETRPLLQGARLTMWELNRLKIPATLITDNMAAFAMQKKMIDLVLVGADRIAANGDVANKIGTLNLAIIARFFDIPFYVAAPVSTFDLSQSSGLEIPIEQRDPQEIRYVLNTLNITITEADCWNPAFDVTPAKLITGIVTDQGILNPPFENSFKRLNYITYQNQEEVNL